MSPAPPRTVALLGTGLIGASLGLALRRRQPDVAVVGLDADPAAAATAREREAVSAVAASVREAVEDADLVVLAAPLDALDGLLAEVGAHARPGALVTDVGSVKRRVMARAAESLPAGVRFVGGHPMAGAARGGPAQADPLLFENAAYVLTPPPGVADVGAYAPEALWLIEAIGARPVVVEAARHDVVAATVSHLPQLLAVALVELAADAGPDALGLAAGGFRDMTRIAGSPFTVWGPILRDNADAVADVLRRFAERLRQTADAVARDPAALAPRFERAGQTRAALPASTKGFLAPLADVVVWAEDRPGFLHGLTTVVAEAGLNLKDVELLRVRVGEVGTFRFGFETDAEAGQAVVAFRATGYRAERR